MMIGQATIQSEKSDYTKANTSEVDSNTQKAIVTPVYLALTVEQ